MTLSPRLATTDLADGQALPESRMNATTRVLEQGVTRFVVVDRDLNDPPGVLVEGAMYLVDTGGMNAWAGHDGDLAFVVNGAWKFLEVLDGWAIEVLDEDAAFVSRGGAWVSAGGGGASGGVQDVPVMASAMKPRTTAGPTIGSAETATYKIMVETLDFPDGADAFAQFMFPMPKSWDEGTITAKFIWTAAVTGDVVWRIEGVALSDSDVLDSAFGAAISVTDSVTSAGDVMHSAFTAAVTIGGSAAERDLVIFQVSRDADHGSDTAAGAAKLLGVVLRLTTDAGDDS